MIIFLSNFGMITMNDIDENILLQVNTINIDRKRVERQIIRRLMRVLNYYRENNYINDTQFCVIKFRVFYKCMQNYDSTIETIKRRVRTQIIREQKKTIDMLTQIKIERA